MKLTYLLKKLLEKYNKLPAPVKASFWFLLCSFLQRGLSVITTPIFTRILTSNDFGMISLYNSWKTIITVFITLNITAGVYMRGLVTYEKTRKEFVSSFESLNLILIIIWTIIYFIFNNFFNELLGLTTPLMIIMFTNIWVTTVFAFWSAEQRVDYKYKSLVIVTILVSLLNSISSIIGVVYCKNKVVAKILIPVIIELIIYSFFFLKHLFVGKTLYSKEYWKYALTFNIPLIPHYLSTTLLNSSDRIMIANMVDLRSAGLYSLAYSISMVLTIFNSSMMSTIEPWLYKKLKTCNYDQMPQLAYSSLSIIACINIVLIAFAPEILAVFAPKEYYDAVWIIPPVAMSVYFIFSYSFFAVFEFYYKKTSYIATATVLGAILNIILNYIFIKPFGYYAAGYTTLLCYIFFSIAHYLFMQKICNKMLNGIQIYNLTTIITISVIFVVIGFLFLFTYHNMVFRYSALTILMIVIIIKRNLIKSSITRIIRTKNKDKQ